MITIVSDNYIKPEYIHEFLNLALELKRKSLCESGNYAYDFYEDLECSTHITFIEKWKNKESIKKHKEKEYFVDFIQNTRCMLDKESTTKMIQDCKHQFEEYDPFSMEMSPKEIKDFPFLIVTKCGEKVNAMTANWGMVGNMWNEPTFLCVVRRTRFTKELLDHSDYFSICLLEDYKKELGYLGTVSGRNMDKLENVGFTVNYIDNVPYIKEAKEVYILKKNFNVEMKQTHILDQNVIDTWYKEGIDKDNFHTIYFGKIIKYFKR